MAQQANDGGQGRGFWLGIGRLSVVAVMCVGMGGGRRNREIATWAPRVLEETWWSKGDVLFDRAKTQLIG